MRWFKHMTDSRNNKNIQAIVGKFGLAGVTRYFWLLEMIAEQMDDSERCEFAFRPGFISRSLGFRSLIDCRSFLEWLAIDRGMIAIQFANEWLVKCDKLLIIRARKKPIGNENTSLDGRWKSKMVDGRVRTPIVPKGDSDEVKVFEEFWKEFPKKRDKQGCLKIWVRKKLSEQLPPILIALRSQKESSQWTRDAGQYIPNPSTWLNQDRWDEVINVGKEKTWQDHFDEKMKAKGNI